jgi:hypothetical protein
MSLTKLSIGIECLLGPHAFASFMRVDEWQPHARAYQAALQQKKLRTGESNRGH